ncbi:MAG: toxin-antitoxin system YwqK family antitoxin [Tenacibaculum sp.]
MIKIKIDKIFLIWLVLKLLVTASVYAQKVNQFNAEGKRTGIWKKYYKNGAIRYQGQFKNGKEIGTFKFYDMSLSTQPIIVKEFSETSDTALVKFYSIDGKLKSKGESVKKQRIGKWLYFFQNGKIISEENYQKGLLHGMLKNYYPSGRLTEQTNYAEGEKHGISKIYSEDGVLLQEENYQKGLLHGSCAYYDIKGELKERGSYNKGKREGKWEFYINGKLTEKKKKKLVKHN